VLDDDNRPRELRLRVARYGEAQSGGFPLELEERQTFLGRQ
jgi:hypothetical protein